MRKGAKKESPFKGIIDQVRPSGTQPTTRPRRKSTPRPTPQLQEQTGQGRRLGKSSDPSYTQATLYIRKETHHGVKMKLLAERQDRDMSDLAEELFSQWLAIKS